MDDDKHTPQEESCANMKSWTCFIVGNTLVIVVLVLEILTLRVCFDGFEEFDHYDDDRIQNRAELDDEDAYEVDEAESIVFYMVSAALIAGLSLQVISSVVLSSTYGSPLDAKSARKIPADDTRYYVAGFVARFLAPFTWGLMCVCMGAASYMYNSYSSCGGNYVSERTRYAFLVVFGLLMACCGGVLVIISLLVACCSCGVEPACVGCCCLFGRRFMHKKVLSAAPIFDLWWQLSGIMWSYRTGSFGLHVTIALLAANIVGEFMCELGSAAPAT